MAAPRSVPSYEILEHTADIGLLARGRTREKLFENAALGLAEILDRRAARRAKAGYAPRPRRVELQALDVEALLVDWLNEVLFVLEGSDLCLGQVRVRQVSGTQLRAEMGLADCTEGPQEIPVKAATYHQLSVERVEDGWRGTVFFDV